LLTFEIVETDAFNRTASGVTFTVPTELTLMYRTGAACETWTPNTETIAATKTTAPTRFALLICDFIPPA
jgi:hypothetical protein